MEEVILVVDDQEINRIGVSCALNSLGYKVDEAPSGEAALVKLQAGNFDAVLMDYHMAPGMTGSECAEVIRARETGSAKRVPIIVLSSETNSVVKKTCLASGIDVFLDKSCSIEKLHETLQSVLKAAS